MIFFFFCFLIGFLAGMLFILIARAWHKRIRYGEKHSFPYSEMKIPKADNEILKMGRSDHSTEE